MALGLMMTTAYVVFFKPDFIWAEVLGYLLLVTGLILFYRVEGTSTKKAMVKYFLSGLVAMIIIVAYIINRN